MAPATSDDAHHDAAESPVERYLPAISLGAAALVLLLLTAGAGGESEAAEAREAAVMAPGDAAAILAADDPRAGVPLDLLPPTEEEARIKALALEAILERPEIVMQAVEILRAGEAEAEALAAAASLAEVGPMLAAGEDAVVLGNPDGDVTVVEFFDYNCGYCRRAVDTMVGLMAADPEVRVVMREFPILSEGSVEAARVALAAHQQGAYEAMHDGLLRMSGRADAASALQMAEALGLDMAQLEVDMADPSIDAHIAASQDFARRLGVNGTPAFVIGDRIIPGAVPLEDLQAAVTAAREEG